MYLLTGELWMARSTFAFLRKDNILSWQMYKQRRSSKEDEPPPWLWRPQKGGNAGGHGACQKSLHTEQGVKITWRVSPIQPPVMAGPLFPLNKDLCNYPKQNAKRQPPSPPCSPLVTDRDFFLKSHHHSKWIKGNYLAPKFRPCKNKKKITF